MAVNCSNLTGTVGKVELISTFTTAVCKSWNESNKYTWNNAGDLKKLSMDQTLRACSHDPGTAHCPGATHWPRGQLCLGAWSDACNYSHEFFIAPGQLRKAGYPLYNTG